MQRFFLYANPGKPETIPTVKEFAELLLNRNCEVHLDHWLYNIVHIGKPCAIEHFDSTFTAVICFGGDGTLLRILPQSAVHQVPVLGINMGHTGFLLEVGPNDPAGILDRLIYCDYTIQERSMLSCQINGRCSNLVMNEFALTRGKNPSSLVVDVLYNNELVYTIHGDGVLVSTPSGTTGYSLSAGGPILYPDLSCHVIVPICSHIMHQRPVVLPQDGEIRLEVRANRGMMHQISMDGQIVLDLDTNTAISIKHSQKTARFIRFTPQRFFTRLHHKQMEWSDHVYGGNL